MNKFQAAFECLYFLSAVDGHVDDRELDVIINFLDANRMKIDFDPSEVVKSISTLSADGMMDELKAAAITFKQQSTASDRTTLLDFGLNLIAADGNLAESEAQLLYTLGSVWDIDMNRYLESRKN